MKHYYFRFDAHPEYPDETPLSAATCQPIFDRHAPVVRPGVFRIADSGPGSIETAFYLADKHARLGDPGYRQIYEILDPANLIEIDALLGEQEATNA